MLKKIALIILIIGVIPSLIYSQDVTEVKISTLLEVVDGKEYYLHFVHQGQTIYSICKAYNVSVEELIENNPETAEGLKNGQLLSIPLKKNLQTEEKDPVKKTADPDYFYHIVKQKETLYGLSVKYGISIEMIKDYNPELEEYPKIGQILKIPKLKSEQAESSPEEWKNNMISHEITAGQTLYQIAKEYGVTVGQIKNANHESLDTLGIGQIILIPQNKTEPVIELTEIPEDNRFIQHTVLPKETLYSLARYYAVSIDTIRKNNPGLKSNIQIGQVLLIPNIKEIRADYIYHRNNEKTKLKELAKQYDVSTKVLKLYNPGLGKRIQTGEIVKIPVEKIDHEIFKEPVSDSIIKDVNEDNEIFYPCEHINKNKKNIYNVALMIPLFLEETTLDMPMEKQSINRISKLKSLRFVQFYQGFLMAADSLKNQGLKLNLFIYDVDNTDEKILKTLSSSELSQMDLIIGPFYKKSFVQISSFAKLYGIKIVNPLSGRDEVIKDNPYAFKIKPSENSIPQLLTSYLKGKLNGDNIILIRKTQYKFQNEIDFLKNSLKDASGYYIKNNELSKMLASNEIDEKTLTDNKIIDPTYLKANPYDSTYFTNIIHELIIQQYDFSKIKNHLSLFRKNVIITYCEDKAFVKELVGQINIQKKGLEVEFYGLPQSKFYNEIETNFLQDLNFHSFTFDNVDYDQLSQKYFISTFRKKYLTDPVQSQYAFDGFDIGWYFLNSLFHYGVNFEECIEGMNLPLIQNEFNFTKELFDGYQNNHWQLIRYEDYKIHEIKILD